MRKKCLCVFLSLVMIFGTFPMTVFAADYNASNQPAEDVGYKIGDTYTCASASELPPAPTGTKWYESEKTRGELICDKNHWHLLDSCYSYTYKYKLIGDPIKKNNQSESTIKFVINNGTWNTTALGSLPEGASVSGNTLTFKTYWFDGDGSNKPGYVYECGTVIESLFEALYKMDSKYINARDGYVLGSSDIQNWSVNEGGGLIYGNYANANAQIQAAGKGPHDFDNHMANKDAYYADTVYTLTLQPVKYTVEYDLEGGTGTISDSGVYYHSNVEGKTSEITVTSEIPTKEGFKFLGWKLDVDNNDSAGNTLYKAGDKIKVDNFWNNTDVVGDITDCEGEFVLEAQWEEVTEYNVTYSYKGTVPSGAPAVPASTTAEKDDTVTVAAVPTLAGYSFDGWKLNGEGSNITSFKMPGSDVVLKGSWSENANVTITYTAETGGSVSVESESLKPATGTAKGSTATAASGYTFVNWTDARGTVVSTSESFTPKKVGGVNVSATYTAHFKANEYDITYELYGGSNASGNPDKYTYGVGVSSFADATRTGFVFMGWYSDSNYTTAVTEIGKTETGTKTLHAKWEAENKDLSVTKEIVSITAPSIQINSSEEINPPFLTVLSEEPSGSKNTAKVGDTIKWLIKIKNNGNVAQTVKVEDILQNGTSANVTLTKKTGETISASTGIEIGAGETAQLYAEYVVQLDDAGKELINSVTASTTDGSATGTSTGVNVDPAVTVTKTADKATAKVGDTVTYTVTVTNNCDEMLYGIAVSDSMISELLEIIETLDVGATWTKTYEYKVKSEDEGKTLINTIIVSSDKKELGKATASTNIDKKKPSSSNRPAKLNYEDHFAYIIGYEDGTVRPQKDITRAEVATIFFRLLSDDSRADYWSQTNEYRDVEKSAWYNNAVSTLSNAGIITGYPDGTFNPNAAITRSEFAAIAARFSDTVYNGGSSFTDVPDDHWAEDLIALAEYLGWINGYPDGSFKPNQAITRAESVTLVNRVLKRAVEKENMLEDMVTWSDCQSGEWYYEAIQEAGNSHTYLRTDKNAGELGFKYEKWTKILPVNDWAALEKEWSEANN